MKKIVFNIATLLILTISCNKKEEGNTSIIVNEDPKTEVNNDIVPETPMDLTNTSKEITYPFKASNGNRAIAKITNTDKENTIVIQANRNMFQLDRKKLTKSGAIYERNGVGAEIKGDSLIITQGNLQIDLVLVQ